MDARKATAAVSAAGFLLIAGCAGGGSSKMGGSLPNAQGQNNTAPANSSRVGLAFTLPARATNAWTTSSTAFRRSQTRTVKIKRGNSVTTRTLTRTQSRQPKYLSPAVLGGSVYVYIYQGNNLALTDGPLTVGTTPSAQIYCDTITGSYQTIVYDCYGNVYAPLGTDTFYVASYDSYHHLLSVTPGMPGGNFYAATQPSYTITSSGYPSAISTYTYAVVATLGVDSPTSCVPWDLAPTLTDMFDAGGYLLTYGPIANPFTVSVSGGISLYQTFPSFAPVSSPYAIYDISGLSELVVYSNYDGANGTISVSTAASPVTINLASTSMNLYTVDRLAFSPTSTGLSVLGLYDNGPSTYACGSVNLASYDTGAAITFTNPVAIGGDDFYPGGVVVDNVSGSPFATLFPLDPELYGLGFYTYRLEAAISSVRFHVSGSNPTDVAVSPTSAGNGMIYILNADGSITQVTTSAAQYLSIEPSGTIPGPSGIGVLYGSGSDSLFLSSSTTSNIIEIDNANTAPSSPAPIPLASPNTSLISPHTYAVSVDNLDGEGYVSFLSFDTSDNANGVVDCSAFLGCSGTLSAYNFNAGAAAANGMLSFAFPNGSNQYWLAASGTNVDIVTQNSGESGVPGTFPNFGSQVTRIISSYDAIWNGVDSGGLFQFFYNLGSTTAGSMSGSYAVIISP